MKNNDLYHPITIRAEGATDIESTGITLREWFAAHAPDVIPPWFKPSLAELSKYPDPKQLPGHLQQLVLSWENDPCYDLSSLQAGDEIKVDVYHTEPWDEDSVIIEKHKLTKEDVACLIAFEKEYNATIDRNELIEKANEIDRYFAWRYFYANQMVEYSYR